MMPSTLQSAASKQPLPELICEPLLRPTFYLSFSPSRSFGIIENIDYKKAWSVVVLSTSAKKTKMTSTPSDVAPLSTKHRTTNA
jgi:hypothetical protein